MSTSLKKLLLISITLLLGVMSGGVMAETVTYIGGNVYQVNNGVSTTDYDFSTITGSYNANTTVLDANPWVDNFSYAQTWATAIGVLSPSVYLNYYGNEAIVTGGSLTTVGVNTSYNYGVATLSGAPEIDGSLAPKVGFLLGCLFLMFGRKKQNTEALLTA